eukprot:GHVR01050133.1.p1 GENE.GHVR01050133.1~~GHVR01050133.1.p1  ORF type:complete len:292 (+),score=147.45 GHVR01050133.1:196-1071(+)
MCIETHTQTETDSEAQTSTDTHTHTHTHTQNGMGLLVTSIEEIKRLVKMTHTAGVQCAVHAIGDRAATIAIDAFVEACGGDASVCRRYRHRIEHCQHILTQDIQRMSQFGLIASMQPLHLVTDRLVALRVLGPLREKYMMPMSSLINNGVCVCIGSDWCVSDCSPLKAIISAVSKRNTDIYTHTHTHTHTHTEGDDTQNIAITQALLGHTNSAAYASFDEKEMGVIAKGALADFCLLSDDFVTPSFESNDKGLETLKRTRVLVTVCGGRLSFVSKDVCVCNITHTHKTHTH